MAVDERLPGEDLQRSVHRAAMNPKPKRGKRSKSVNNKLLIVHKYPPLLETEDSSFSDSKSMKMPIVPENLGSKSEAKEPPVVKNSFA